MRGSSAGADPAALEPGADLVLHAPRAHGESLRPGVLLDDWVPLEEREPLDREARRRLAAWRALRDAQLTIEGVCLPHIFELELYTDVFLRETRVFGGLRAALSDGAPGEVELSGLDPDLAASIGTLLSSLGAHVQLGSPGEPPAYPLIFRRVPSSIGRVTGALRETLGIPGRVRGTVLVEPYWNLGPLWEPLLERPETVPVANPADLPALPARSLLRMLGRGGWVGHPGLRRRRRSRRALAAALEALAERGAPPGDPLDELLDLRARRFLAARAGDGLAQVESYRAAFRSGRPRALVVPSDTSAVPRMAILAAQERGAAVVQVQHGLFTYVPMDEGRPARVIDGWLADHVAVWSERDARTFGPHLPGRVTVTGNPGAAALAHTPPSRGQSSGDRVLVLGQMPAPLSTVTDVRLTWRHLRAALEGLSSARPGSEVAIRPHPLDLERETYARIGLDYPALRVTVEPEGGIEQAIGRADLCVGATSTATLQSTLLGTPCILLEVTGLPLSWPFDGSGDFPTARSAEELEGLIGELEPGGEIPGRGAALEALGARPDAVDRVTELIAEAAR